MSKIAGWAIGIGAVLVSAGVVFVYMVFDLMRERAVDDAAWSLRDTELPPRDHDPDERPE
ncbi:hypothetical protein [Streptomyces sp. 11x1]|uniref:hypothetical protein n=1 Tax=Streptomyces sp. 11x1 TaxID=3038642 RepID=UPI00292EBFEC|nr:hypothetical protein [Streptomyces sp. 11x1]WNZ09146.1 hypothetical protein P8T65_17210 [Streptomyces sp. 11x1]